MKERREISGIFFRYQNPETKKWENWVFEDLPKEEQEKICSMKEKEWVANLAILLADRLHEICEQFDITTIPREEDTEKFN